MQDDRSTDGGVRAPSGEPLPLVVWLARDDARVAARLGALGAYAVAAPGDAESWPRAVAEAVAECRARFARAYVIRLCEGAPACVAAGLPGTSAHDADPWTVALVLGAVRDTGVAAERDPARPGGSASDDLQGVELTLPRDAADTLVAAVAALADGLRIAQLKC